MDGVRDRRITFGKHQGTPVCHLPEDYLAWCCDNLRTGGRMLADLRAELSFRRKFLRPSCGCDERDEWVRTRGGRQTRDRPPPEPKPEPKSIKVDLEVVKAAVVRWGRAELIRTHPDRNGWSAEANAIHNAVKVAVERLIQELDRVPVS